MLSSLHIENIAVIKSTDLDFGKGFHVLTGETGAGKSILIDSIELLLGGRAARDLIRNGETRAIVSGVFSDIGKPISRAGEVSIPVDGEGMLYITREIDINGKSKTRVNGALIPTSVQKEIMSCLISIHGQNDNRMLLSVDAHREYLDSYAGCGEMLAAYQEVYGKMTACNRELHALNTDAREKTRTMELLTYQLQEIDGAGLRPGEEEELTAERDRVKNAEKIAKAARTVVKALYRSERSLPAYELIRKAAAAAESIRDYLPDAEGMIARLNEAAYTLEDIGLTVEAATGEDEEDPEAALDRVETRLDAISKLERKYGADIDEILAYREKIAGELSSLNTAEERAEELKKELSGYMKEASRLAGILSTARHDAAKRLEEGVISELAFLEMPKVRFRVDLKKSLTAEGKTKLTKYGTDTVEFLLSANPGEPLKPLAKIASGGELSRIMLALRTVNAKDSEGETLIFDEIDTGVSGKTSQKIGMRLRALAASNQILCVTHSAQIAAEAHSQLLIRKQETDGRVETSVTPLTREERVKELARIMGGVNITDKLLSSAEELLALAERES